MNSGTLQRRLPVLDQESNTKSGLVYFGARYYDPLASVLHHPHDPSLGGLMIEVV